MPDTGFIVTVNSDNSTLPWDYATLPFFVPFQYRFIASWQTPLQDQQLNTVNNKTVYPTFNQEIKVL